METMCAAPDDTTTDTKTDTKTDTTTDGTGECCDVDGQEPDDGDDVDDWLDDDTLDQPLPEELQQALGRFVGTEPIETLADWAAEMRRFAGNGQLAVDDLCHATEATDHWGEVDGERYYFQCFYDAVILAALEDRAVDVHTTSPGGAVVEARAVGTETLTTTPEDAVFSLGIALDADEQSGGDPTLRDGYAAVCPYVRAFPDRAAYEAWATEVPAATVATPLSGATAFAQALIEEGDGS